MARRKTSIKRARTAPSVVPALFDPDAAATGEGLFGLDTAAQVARVVVIPVPFDATTSYRAGTANGPAAMLQASKQVDLQDLQFGGVWKAGIAMLPIPKRIAALSRTARSAALPILQAGGARAGNAVHAKALAIVNAASETVHAYVREAAKGILARGAIPALLGGDHASPYALIAELSRKHSGMGILQIDAHADLRQRFEGFTWSHASIFHNVLTRLPGVARLTQVGIRDIAASEIAFINNSKGRVKTFFEQQMRDQQFAGGARGTWGALCKQIVATLPKDVYISFDIDGLTREHCPDTGTPVPGGLSFSEACHLLGVLRASGKRIIGFDLCEVSPAPHDGEWNANVGARVLYKLAGCALK